MMKKTNIYCINYNSMIGLVKDFRNMGYNIITFTRSLCELEKGPDFIIIRINGGGQE